ncbi:hypothetical protein Tco_1538612 [Tanacetum coccineum]
MHQHRKAHFHQISSSYKIQRQRDRQPITPPSESRTEEAQWILNKLIRTKDMQKKLALICKVLQKTLQTDQQQPQNFLKHQNKTGYDSKIRRLTSDWTFWESRVECRKPKTVLRPPRSQGKYVSCVNKLRKVFTSRQKQSDWLTDHVGGNLDETRLEAHNSYMAKIQEVPKMQTQTQQLTLNHWNSNTCGMETVIVNVLPATPYIVIMISIRPTCVECEDERAALANLMAN